MMVMTTAPGPGAASCAKTSVVPLIPATASSTAIQRVISNLLEASLLWASRAASTIRQERDLPLCRARDARATRPHERRLRLLDDGPIGHVGLSKRSATLAQTAR